MVGMAQTLRDGAARQQLKKLITAKCRATVKERNESNKLPLLVKSDE